MPIDPLAPAARHPADYRDDIEHAEVARVLSELRPDHPACVAYLAGVREAADSICLSHLLAERMDLVHRLVGAYFGHNNRIWTRYSSTGRLGAPSGRTD